MSAPSLPDPPLFSASEPQLGDAALFSELAYSPFLAHAAIAPLPSPAIQVMQEYALSLARYGNGAFPMWAAQRERLRASLANMLGVELGSVALSPGCTHSITDVALALPWQEGQEIVLFRGEFPANVVPYQQAAEVARGQVHWLDLPPAAADTAAAQILDTVERAFRARGAKIAHLAVSAVQFQSGLRMPLQALGALCERYGVTFLIDGIQACGVVPVCWSEVGADAFFVGAHKWLLGSEGAGACMVAPRLAQRLNPKTAGWLSKERGADFLFQGSGLLRYDHPYVPAPRVFEGSTANAVGLAVLEAGVDIVMKLGPAAIFEHVQKLHDYLEPRLTDRGFKSLRSPDPELRSCILSLLPPPELDLGFLFRELDRRQIRVSIPDGVLRLAPHFHNNLDQLRHFTEVLDDIMGR